MMFAHTVNESNCLYDYV